MSSVRDAYARNILHLPELRGNFLELRRGDTFSATTPTPNDDDDDDGDKEEEEEEEADDDVEMVQRKNPKIRTKTSKLKKCGLRSRKS